MKLQTEKMRFLITYVTKLTLNSPQLRFYSEDIPQALRSVKSRSTRATVQYYVDSQRVKAIGGNGGDGCVSFMHAWCKDRAGPDGGDGGNGGHVIFKASMSVRSLNHISRVIKAESGEKGYNKECHGKSSPHVTVPVPVGTVVKDSAERVVCDLSAEGRAWVAARGGAGGRGNQFFLTALQQAPDIAELGAEGESHTYTLEVRSMAHIGLIGFPNAGKSTLLRAVSRARPAVAPYPFTTRHPHLGMVPYSDYEQVAVADLPGLIPGSHKNYGLGIQFLKHVERCCGLLYVIDGTSENPFDQYQTLHTELTCYSAGLSTRPCQIVVNKIDVPEGRLFYEKLKKFLANGGTLAEFGKKLSGRGKKLSQSGNRLANDPNMSDLDKTTSKTTAVKYNHAETSLLSNDKLDRSCNNCSDLTDSNVKDNIFNSKDTSNTQFYSNPNNNSKNTDIILGISAKTGEGIPKLLAVLRKMYDHNNLTVEACKT